MQATVLTPRDAAGPRATFQSSPDPLMALRMLEYATMIWRTASREDPTLSKDELPPIVPVVLTNGPSPWRAPTDVRELVALGPGTWFEPYVPRMRYVLLDEVRLAAQAQPREERGLPGLLFELEAAEYQEDFSALLVRLMERTRDLQALRELFVTWFFKVACQANCETEPGER
ncbi:MAG: Rpn family recombination-promoting nuclease/putative transposase [Myxococcota bacterium]